MPMMVRMMMMQQMMRKEKADKEDGGGKAFKRVHNLRHRVQEEPRVIVGDYLSQIMDKMGVEDGDSWQPWHFTSKISWGRLAGLRRVHFHLSHILTLQLRGQNLQSQAYTVQLLRALHQVSLDGGGWQTAMLLLPKADPLQKEAFGATERELEAIVAYQEAMKRIKPVFHGDDGNGEKTEKEKKGKGKGEEG